MFPSQLLALQDPYLISPAIGYILIGILGVIIGSFLNVVIHRVPLEESIVFPNSKCPACGGVIAFYDNIPLLSYIVLRGKCRGCKKHISIRYPFVELVSGLLFVAVAWHDGLTFALPFDLIFTSALLALVFIDAEHMLLPNAITYPGIIFAVVARLALPYLIGNFILMTCRPLRRVHWQRHRSGLRHSPADFLGR
jgi:leader peptidase (prepilin peptidase)/N-methyltransferase